MEKKIEFKDITINTLKASNQSLAADEESREIESAKLRIEYENLLKSDEAKSESILKKHDKWNDLFCDFDMETIAKYSTLSLVGRSKYTLMRNVIRIPIPCYSTLQKIRSKIKVKPGYIQFSFDVLREKVKPLSGIDLECVLSFDETSISGKYVFDEKLGRIVSENSLLAVQVRSITDVFRQTIYFQFEGKISIYVIY